MALDPTSCLMIDDDILNFSLGGEDEDLDDEHNTTKPPSSSFDFSKHNTQHPDDCSGSFPGFPEEELEWLSNKDAFPAVETCFDMLLNPIVVDDHHSPNSVLENTTSTSHSNSNSNNSRNGSGGTITSCCVSLHVPISYPVRKRSKRRHRRRRVSPSWLDWWWNQANMKKHEPMLPAQLAAPQPAASPVGIGRRCQHCLAEKTPQWRAGPMGPKTLCNACGVRFKSGRLVPEYRPANSPTFSSVVHSNSHRKIMEMRRQKQDDGGTMVKKACGYGVG